MYITILLYVRASVCVCFTTMTRFLLLFILCMCMNVCAPLIVFAVLFWNPQLAASRYCDIRFLLSQVQVCPLSAVPRHRLVSEPLATLTPIWRQRGRDGLTAGERFYVGLNWSPQTEQGIVAGIKGSPTAALSWLLKSLWSLRSLSGSLTF